MTEDVILHTLIEIVRFADEIKGVAQRDSKAVQDRRLILANVALIVEDATRAMAILRDDDATALAEAIEDTAWARNVIVNADLLAACEFGGLFDSPTLLREAAQILSCNGQKDLAAALFEKAELECTAIAKARGEDNGS